jgi:ABC-type transport system involved in multi-copper enzyme maturation permease subunit
VDCEAASIVLAASAVRALIVLGLVVFVCFHVQRLFESREIEALLARPLRRGQLVLAYWLAGTALAVGRVRVPSAGLAILNPPSLPGLAVWCASLLLESMLVVALALTISLALGSAVAATLATLTMYAFGREIGFVLAITGGEFGLSASGGTAGQWADIIMRGLAVMVPRLDLFGQTEWLIYGPAGGIGAYWFVAQAVVYIGLLLTLAAYDLRQRRF